jgi:thiopeptide-type bacteriocin biosynthesis protein
MRHLEGGRLTVEQYERDLERWGGPTGMLIAERWWHADSEASVTVLRSRSSSDALALAVCAAERGLIDLGLSAADRATAVQVALHEVNDGLLSAVPRDHAGSEATLAARPIAAMADELGDSPTLMGAYDAQRETWTALADELGAADRSGELEIPGVAFAGRLLRTRVNRLLGLPTHNGERLIYSQLNHRADLLREQGSGPRRVDS